MLNTGIVTAHPSIALIKRHFIRCVTRDLPWHACCFVAAMTSRKQQQGALIQLKYVISAVNGFT
jgi:hypothetical protein